MGMLSTSAKLFCGHEKEYMREFGTVSIDVEGGAAPYLLWRDSGVINVTRPNNTAFLIRPSKSERTKPEKRIYIWKEL